MTIASSLFANCPVADRAVAGTARPSMRSQRDQMRQATGGEVDLDSGKAVRANVSMSSTAGFRSLIARDEGNMLSANRARATLASEAGKQSRESFSAVFLTVQQGLLTLFRC